MAAHATGNPSSLAASISDEEFLSDDQIKELLQDAEARLRLNSSLQSKPLAQELTTLPTLDTDNTVKTYIKVTKGAARVDPSCLRKMEDQNLAERVGAVETKLAKNQRRKREKEATAGPDWFNLPRTNLTPELKRDLQLLNLRSVLDPKRHYKKQNTKAKPPAFLQVGMIIESPAEYFNGRLLNKERKETLADEVLAGEAENRRFKTAYARVQATKASGRKAAYKTRMKKRSGRGS